MIARLMGLATISPTTLHERLRDGGAVTVIDVNAPDRWAEAHIPGAANLAPTTYEASELPADRDAELVFYCSNALCRKAPHAARRARQLGYENVRVLSAGIRGWRSANLPTEADG